MKENFRFLRPYLRGLPIIILFMILGYIVASQYLKYTVPIYEGTSKLKFADINKGVSSTRLYKDFDFFANSNEVATDIEVIKSALVIGKMVDANNLEIEYYRIGRMMTTELFDRSPFIVKIISVDKKHYNRAFDIQIASDKEFSISIGGEVVNGSFGDTIMFGTSETVILLNQKLIDDNKNIDIIDHYQFKIRSRDALINDISKSIDVVAVDKNIPVVRISYQSSNPVKAAFIPNKLAEMYITDYIESKHEGAIITEAFLDSQLVAFGMKVSEIEDKIQKYRDAEGITNISQETETELRKVSQLKVQQTNLKMSLDAIKHLEEYVNITPDKFLDLAPTFEQFTDLLSTEIVKKIKDLQSEKLDLLLVYTPEEESVKVIDKKISNLFSYLIESIKNSRKNLEVKYNELSNDILQAEKFFVGMPEKEKLLMIMNREFQLYQQSFNYLNEKKIEAQITKSVDVAFHRIITPSVVPMLPISPNRMIIKFMAVLLSMIFALLSIFIVHSLKAKVNDAENVKLHSSIPIVMLTPKIISVEERKLHFLKQVSHLDLKGLLPINGVICFSSFSYNEGAEYNGLGIARALSAQGKNVLVLDVTDNLKLSPASIFSTSKLSDNLSICQFNDDKLLLYSKRDFNGLINRIKEGFDYLIILNDNIGKQVALMCMASADNNLIVLDTRNTPMKRIAEVNTFKEEYKMENIYFTINRQGYNPTIRRDIWKFINTIFKKERKDEYFFDS